jgi:hypothetical protein
MRYQRASIGFGCVTVSLQRVAERLLDENFLILHRYGCRRAAAVLQLVTVATMCDARHVLMSGTLN